jgi:class 3 adenylate cyclase
VGAVAEAQRLAFNAMPEQVTMAAQTRSLVTSAADARV